MGRLAAASVALALLGAAPVLALDPGRAPNRYGHDAWLTRDGLPQESVQAVTQTSDGYLWIGTRGGGIRRFRGGRRVPDEEPDSPGRTVTTILQDRRGNVWFGTTEGLAMLEGTRLVRYESLPHSFVYCIFEDRAGAVWVGTRGGLTRIIDGAVT